MLLLEGVSQLAKIESMAEKIVRYPHASRLKVLQRNDCQAGRGHPGHEADEVFQLLTGLNVIEGV